MLFPSFSAWNMPSCSFSGFFSNLIFFPFVSSISVPFLSLEFPFSFKFLFPSLIFSVSFLIAFLLSILSSVFSSEFLPDKSISSLAFLSLGFPLPFLLIIPFFLLLSEADSFSFLVFTPYRYLQHLLSSP